MTTAPDVAAPDADDTGTRASPVKAKRRGNRRTRWIIGGIIAGVILAVVAIGAVVVVSLQNTSYSPTAAVTGYTDDIAAGRFASAWSASGATTSAGTALVEAADVELASAISEVSVGEPVVDGDTRSIPVSYEIDGQPGEGTIVVRSVGKELLLFDLWQIESGLETEAQVAATGMTEAFVGGVAVPLEETGTTVAAYPGVYTVAGPESEWVTVAAEPLIVSSSGGETVVALSASDALAGEVEKQVSAQLDECARSISPEPEGCPFRILVWNDVDAVTWRIDSDPRIELTGYESFIGTGGAVSATYTEQGVGAGRSTQSFSVNGTIAIADDTVTATLSGY